MFYCYAQRGQAECLYAECCYGSVMAPGTQPMRQSHDIQHDITQNDYK